MMANQILDRKTIAIPGPMGDVTPSAGALRDEIKGYAQNAVQASLGAVAASDSAEAAAREAGEVSDDLRADVPVLVADAIAADPTVADAAAAAVADELNEAGVVVAESAVSNELVFTSENGTDTWMQAGNDGRPTRAGMTLSRVIVGGVNPSAEVPAGEPFFYIDDDGVAYTGIGEA